MSTDTKRLRDLAVRSNDGVLRGPALEAADEIDRLRADAEESGRALILAGRVNKKLTDEAMGLVADNKRLREVLQSIVSDHEFCGDDWGDRRNAWIATARAAIQEQEK